VPQELIVFGNDAINLGLLQHDLRYQDCVWVIGATPRQVPGMAVVPIQQRGLDLEQDI
jgi:hypothetical protein